MYKRVYDFSPPHLILTMYSLGAEEPQPTTEHPKQNKTYKSTKQNTQIHKLTHKSKLQPPPIYNKTTHI